MAVLVPHRAIEAISGASDPKKAIWDMAGNLAGLHITGDKVLVGIYVRPEKTKGGIIRPDMNKEEDIWQGKVGLVLKWGTNAFQDTSDYAFDPEDRVSPDEWCVFNIGDTRLVRIRDCQCRVIRDVDIMMRVDDPTIIL